MTLLQQLLNHELVKQLLKTVADMKEIHALTDYAKSDEIGIAKEIYDIADESLTQLEKVARKYL